VHDDGPQSAAELEDRGPLAPVPSAGEDDRMCSDPARCQGIEKRMTRVCLVEDDSDVDIVSGARLSVSKQLHDALKAANRAGGKDMEEAHANDFQQAPCPAAARAGRCGDATLG